MAGFEPGSSCTTTSAVTSNTRGPGFESSHRQLLLNMAVPQPLPLFLVARLKGFLDAGQKLFF